MSVKTYADKQNAIFQERDSNYVDVGTRLKDCLKLFPILPKKLKSGTAEWIGRNPKLKKWADMALVTAAPTDLTLADIDIDTTMQRQVNWRHILAILLNFCESMVMPIQCNINPETGRLNAWDGQHTVIVLYIIAVWIFGLNPKEVKIPVNIYPRAKRLEIRRNFILLNGDAKDPLDAIDIVRSMIMGVNVDGSDDPEWIEMSEKQAMMGEVGLFMTNKKFGDEDEIGAFTLLADTVYSKKKDKQKDKVVTQMFCDYWAYINQERPVEAKEARQLFEFFNLLHEQGIEVSDDYLVEFSLMAKKLFDADFSPNGQFWTKVRTSFENWFKAFHRNDTNKVCPKTGDIVARNHFSSEMYTGLPFLIAQMNKSLPDLQTPFYDAPSGYKPKENELW